MSFIKFSAYAEDCFLIKLFSVPARSEVLLDLLLTKEKNLLCNILVSDN